MRPGLPALRGGPGANRGRCALPRRCRRCERRACRSRVARSPWWLIRGSSRHDDRLATTSRASDRAPAATHALADPGSAAGRCSAVSAPSPRAMSRAPRARPNTRAARSSAAAPTHGRAGTEGQARAVRPSATRPAATARAPRRSSAATAVALTCARPSSVPARASPGRYAPDDHNRRSPSARSPAATAGDQAQPGRDAVHPPVLVPEGRLEPAPGEVWDCTGWKSASESAFGLGQNEMTVMSVQMARSRADRLPWFGLWARTPVAARGGRPLRRRRTAPRGALCGS